MCSYEITETTTIDDIESINKNMVERISILSVKNIEILSPTLLKRFSKDTILLFESNDNEYVKKIVTYLSDWYEVSLFNIGLTTENAKMIKYTKWHTVDLSENNFHPKIGFHFKDTRWHTVYAIGNNIGAESCFWLKQAKWHTVDLRENRIDFNACFQLKDAPWNDVDLSCNNIGNKGCYWLKYTKWHTLHVFNANIGLGGYKYLEKSDLSKTKTDSQDFDFYIDERNIRFLNSVLSKLTITDLHKSIISYL